ncbi:LysM peptidoglycan-binding domain-containing protein [Secundilactobacillus kimchicus]|uniref:LysM domain-containing protein n=1 Tax=Secundilactobacillus kimchicus JCM 15530 TaxID=1302272 RepID=A0A0R1HX78_9LACO|nr:LysM peptidoglycan-binding domain-containing protein [Secundilactobacillus kimchicus]KRK47415.1 hypothetical protein FC96_GL002534 [Secundilactobacillus kimchicus JCM 15530]
MLKNTFLTRGLVVLGALFGFGIAATEAHAATYTVKSGDSLWSISQKFNTTPQAIVNANSSKLSSVSSLILPSDKLAIKKHGAATKTATKVEKAPYKADTAKVDSKTTSTNTQTSTGWMTMEATAYDPQVAAGGATSIPTGTGVAAALDRFPKGTQLEIKYADGYTETRVVNDTGTFAASNPNQLDISMTNAEALQFGRQSIQVRVLG